MSRPTRQGAYIQLNCVTFFPPFKIIFNKVVLSNQWLDFKVLTRDRYLRREISRLRYSKYVANHKFKIEKRVDKCAVMFPHTFLEINKFLKCVFFKESVLFRSLILS